ncbi:uncharacterized protein EV420DRAFT_1656699 [Desarmillaria tabescens]|uniref:Uncharacterized protein n=1 Tax=Armillaria tabescens TaxID=1929756 RepID=A0AA39IWY7_ARMTA|nr:uncharacterized protein EV420DRAFT_1656699 [Desarmillaria tabescens]KAK0431385.1 hypothetical protein EV420DRAFT_1656699 [Desarmillaria tabescens]
MSQSIAVPRARCTHATDEAVTCHCPLFNAPSSLSQDQLICVDCGHGVHAHVDYESKVVYHNPTTHCVAFAQKAYKSQACTCTIQLFDHEPIVNAYRSISVPHSPVPPTNSLNNIPPSNANAAGLSSGNAIFAITSTPIPSINIDSYSPGDINSMLHAPVPVTFQSNSVLHFSQDDAYAFVSDQQSDGASLVTGFPIVHHAPEGYYDYQGHSFEMHGAPSAGA